MKILVFRNKEEASQYAANIITNKLREKPDLRLGLATGSTPILLYQDLVNDHVQNQTSWSNVITFNLDEYKGLSAHDVDSYHHFMNEHLFSKININDKNTFFPNAKTDYDDLIKQYGGIDIQILGIGRNGHIAFNEPGASEYSKTRLVDLDQDTIQVNANKFFNGDIKKVPTQAFSMGLKTIMEAKQIILLAFGADKSKAIQTILQAQEYNKDCPATVLIKHPNVLVLVDSEVNLGM